MHKKFKRILLQKSDIKTRIALTKTVITDKKKKQ